MMEYNLLPVKLIPFYMGNWEGDGGTGCVGGEWNERETMEKRN